MNANEEADSQQAAQWEIVRIYFNRLHLKESGFWKGLSRSSAALRLAKEALSEGISFAVVTVGAAGFVPGAKHVSAMGEFMPETLPSCLELVGPLGRINDFLDSRQASLADSIVIRMQGKLSVRAAGDDRVQ